MCGSERGSVTSSQRRPDIQGLRAIAVIVVVAFHAGLPVPGGFVGVDVFFVISGYVITAMLQREWTTNSRIDFPRFYIRRFKRLTPALATTVAVTIAAAFFVLSPLGPQQTAAKTGIGAMLLAANYAIAQTTGDYFDAPAATNPLLNLWSLSVEEQFYLAFPLILFIGWKLGRRFATAIVAVVTLLSFTAAMLGTGGVGAEWFGFYSPIARAWEFGVGALIALMALKFRDDRAPRVALVGLALVIASLWAIDERTPFPSTWTLLPVVGTALLIMSGSTAHPISRCLASRPMVKVGDWSYSLYLWHWPLIVLATIAFPNVSNVAVAAALISVLPALISYRFVEEPIRNRDFTIPKLVRVVAVTNGVPIVAAVLALTLATNVLTPQYETAVADSQAMHAGYGKNCHFGPGWGNVDPHPCVWNGNAAGAPVYLLGDSNAAQFAEALIDAAKTTGRPLHASTSSGCPYLDLLLQQPRYPGYDARCEARNQRLQDWITAQPRGTVVLASSDEYWLSSTTGVDVDGHWNVDVATKVRLYRESLQRVVKTLQSAGHRVLLVQGVPHFVDAYTWDLSLCSATALRNGCVKTMPLSWSRERTKLVDDAIAQVATVTGAKLLDLADAICPDGECRTSAGNFPIYRDGTHITVAMSHRLAPQFAAAL